MFRTQKLKIAAALWAALACSAAAQDRTPPEIQPDLTYVYTAKFVCISAPVGAATDETAKRFGSASYITVLNFLNPGDQPAKLGVVATRATPFGSAVAGGKRRAQSELAAGSAEYISCVDIRAMMQIPDAATSFDGYVEIESNRRLEADAVYTTVNIASSVGPVQSSVDVEPVRMKVRRRPLPMPLP